jgi:hypothetical protein
MVNLGLGHGKQGKPGDLTCGNEASKDLRRGDKEQWEWPLDIHSERMGRASMGWLGS